ncbi:lipid-A-disaccharide synthase [Polluticaenibacter yanchengensis]|uniref:Lipid-A-disaccharide synthase n=1 Tax=Polluticaenibacter yanchengensis TaxID=3014562 RepID=A0ABT4UH73_9BACT|nr:lipid-A-disaccharide synthase [Chitinophagaceae bacterium LY-5]
MKYYVIAGEASGDLHGSNLLKQLFAKDPAAEVRCWGGHLMESAGATLVKHYKDLAFMGFVEVLANLRTIFKNIAFCKEDIESYQPDVLILIDYPGFNLRIAKWAKSKGLKVIYYISPQVWAWKENRVKMMRQCIGLMLVILPFEKPYYKNKWQWEVNYVGHPLLPVIEDFKANNTTSVIKKNRPLVAILPGSRKQEINVKLPVMLEATKQFTDCDFVVAKAPGLDESFYNGMLAPYTNVKWVSNQTYQLLSEADAAIVTSGTATLETALFEVPEVVCYKGNSVSYAIAKRIITIKYISLVNLIMDRPLVKELIQFDMTAENIVKELKLLLYDQQYQQKIKAGYKELKNILTVDGNASETAANAILKFMDQQ